jgi:choline-glycine betaine transporter
MNRYSYLTKDFNIVILSWMMIIFIMFVIFLYYNDTAKQVHTKVNSYLTKDFNIVILSWMITIFIIFVIFLYYNDIAK